MCGLAGLTFNSGVAVGLAEKCVRKMLTRMHDRGPDAEGVWACEGVVLGHRRLAILDLDARANQPMLYNDGRYAIVFNGEIYNFRELRQQLEIEGVSFRTASDTEVLLALFAREGEHMLPRLRGMFAFAIWDAQSRELFLARDPYGIKPLYYARTCHGFVFASQVKALLASGLVATEREPAGLAGFYLWGSVPEPWTLYRGTYSLPSGHWLRVHEGVAATPVCWHAIRSAWQDEGRNVSAGELQERVRQAVTDAVRAHLVADVPVSVFLSGGIDSGVVAGIAAEQGAKVEGITIGFKEFVGKTDDEVPFARTIAGHFGLPHHVREISRAEFEQDIPSILNAMDQPSVDGVNTWFASKAAAERGYKVVLSGIGGDELFFGYSLFRQLPRQVLLARALTLVPGRKALLTRPFLELAKRRLQPKIAGIPEWADSLEGLYFLRRSLFLPSELPGLMGIESAQEGLISLGGNPPGMIPADARNVAAGVGLLESTHYLRCQLLRDSDWASMAHSLELRTPLVDAKLLETLGPYLDYFAHGVGKMILGKVATPRLPDCVINRRKTGFSTPMEQWLSTQESTVGLPSIASRAQWARRWARIVVEAMDACT